MIAGLTFDPFTDQEAFDAGGDLVAHYQAPLSDGVTYVNNSEDGNLYAIGPDGQLRERLFMQKSIGAAYTPLALDHDGRIFSLNNGVLQIVGR